MTWIGSATKKIKRQYVDQVLLKFGVEIKEFASELDYFTISERLKRKSIDLVISQLARFFSLACLLYTSRCV